MANESMTWQDLQQEILEKESILPALAETSPVHAARAAGADSVGAFGTRSPQEDAARDAVLTLVDQYLAGQPVLQQEIPREESIFATDGGRVPQQEPSVIGGLLSPGSTALELAGVPEQFIPLPQQAKYSPQANIIMDLLGGTPSDRAAYGAVLDSLILGPLVGGVGKLAKATQAALPAAGQVARGAKALGTARQLFGTKGMASVAKVGKEAPDVQALINRVDEVIKKIPEALPDLEKSTQTLHPDVLRVLSEVAK